jgi:hypothetical protein
MALETGTYISDLVATNPLGTDGKNTADNHLRLIKATLLATFPSVTGAVTPTHTQLNKIGTTQAPGTNNTDVASTAFVQAAIATVNAATSTTVSVVAGTTQTAVAGSHYVLTNVAATTVTLPASPASADTVWVTVANSLATNVIARNGNTIMGLSEDLTLNSAYASVQLRYVNSSWRIV